MGKVFRSSVLAVGLVLSLAGSALAQEVSVGCYLVPQIAGVMTTFMPKYINSRDMPGRRWASLGLGIEPEYLICANLTADEHTFVASQPDAFAFPANLDSAVGGNPNLNRVKNALEQRNIPGDQVTATTTWRQVMGAIGRMGLILQRLNGSHHTRLFPPGVSLDTQPDGVTFEQLMDSATSLGIDTSVVNASMTIREMLHLLTVQMPPFFLLTETF